jgi:hypothetical protein
LYAGACRGAVKLVGQQRLSDFLGSERDQLTVDDATVARGGGSVLATGRQVIIERRHILFVVDLEDASKPQESNQVLQREPLSVTVGVGPYWIQGVAHVPPGGRMDLLFSGMMAQFLPLTEARLVTQPDATPRTFLINREHRHSLIV